MTKETLQSRWWRTSFATLTWTPTFAVGESERRGWKLEELLEADSDVLKPMESTIGDSYVFPRPRMIHETVCGPHLRNWKRKRLAGYLIWQPYQEWSQHWVQTTVTECIEPKGVVSPGSGMGHAWEGLKEFLRFWPRETLGHGETSSFWGIRVEP